MRYPILFVLLLTAGLLTGQAISHPLLQSGPMLGYSEMREVLLWVQTSEPAEVHFEYWTDEQPDTRFRTRKLQTDPYFAHTAKLRADRVQPGQAYTYQLFINGEAVALPYPTTFRTQPVWKWRTDAPDFSVAIGSCTYVNEPVYDRPGNPYGGEYGIFQTIHGMRPDLMLWLGDNIYLREADWFSRTGILHRYTHTRSLPEMQPLLASSFHYAIWDDHDYGPNDSDRSWIHKETALEAFDLFWGNPTLGQPGVGGNGTAFQYMDMDFFLLDGRYFRTPNDMEHGEQMLLGRAQLEWLVESLVYSQAPFKMVAVGGQMLNTAQRYETFINLAPQERAYLLERIEEEEITGVIFLTGDRHHTELSRLVNAKGNVVYDLTCSPLTSGVANPNEENRLRVEGTLVKDRNFGLLNFRGPRNARELYIQIFDTEGTQLWDYTIPQPERK